MASNSSQFTARICSIQQLTDRDLSRELNRLNTQKQELDAELLLYLSEVDRRGLYRGQSCSSLFEFCVTRLGCSEEVAYKRVGAARLSRQFPVVLELLANGRIHLTGLMLLKPHLTETNHQEWLAIASGKSRRQLEKLIASRFPKPDARTSVRKLPEAKKRPVVTFELSSVALQAATGLAQPNEASPTSPTDTSMKTRTTSEPGEHLLDKPARSNVEPPKLSGMAIPSNANIGTAPIDTPQTAPPGAAQVRATQTTSPGMAQSAAVESSTTHPTLPEVSHCAFPSPDQSGRTQTRSPNAATPPRIAPLSNHSYRVVFTASERLKQKLDRACELLSHVIPPSDLPAVIERALAQLIEREEERRYGLHTRTEDSRHSSRTRVASVAATEQPVTELGDSCAPTRSKLAGSRIEKQNHESPDGEPSRCAAPGLESPDGEPCRCAAPGLASLGSDAHAPCKEHAQVRSESQDPDPNPGIKPRRRSRYVPAAVRREVFTRDGGQCTFVDQLGRRCEQRHFLEFEHREAFAIGGEETVENLTLLCRAHNVLEAERLFGRERIASAIASARRRRAQN